MQPTDHVNLCCTRSAGLRCPLEDVIKGQGIAAVIITLFTAESAEGTAIHTDIRVIDVPGDDKVDPVPIQALVGPRGAFTPRDLGVNR